jgi:hypothetical protein
MASRRNRNRNRTQRKNKNKNRSRRNRQGGGAASISCNNAQKIVNDPSAGMVKKMAAKVQLKSCATGMKTVTPNMKWSNTRINAGNFKKCNAGYNPDGVTCINGAEPHLPNDFEEASSPRA